MATKKKTSSKKKAPKRRSTTSKAKAKTAPKKVPAKARDPRLPAVGGKILRRYKGKDYELKVTADGFALGDVKFKSLTAAARAISGYAAVSGWAFFGLTKRAREGRCVMKIGPRDRFWVVTRPSAVSDVNDICFESDLRGLTLQVRGGLDLGENVAIYDDHDEAVEDAKNRLLVRRVAERIRIERGLPADEVVRDHAPRRGRQGGLEGGGAMRIFQPKWKLPDGEWRHGRVYWCQFSVGGKLHRKTLKTRDKRVAQMRAGLMVERAEKKAVGLASPFEEHLPAPAEGARRGLPGVPREPGRQPEPPRRPHVLPPRVPGGGEAEDDPRDRHRRHAAVAGRAGRGGPERPEREQAVPGAAAVRALARDDAAVGLQPVRGAQRPERGDGPAAGPAGADRRTSCGGCSRSPGTGRWSGRSSSGTGPGVTPAQRLKLLRLGEARAFLYEMAAATGLRRGELQGTGLGRRGRGGAVPDRPGHGREVEAAAGAARPGRTCVEGLAAHRERLEAGGFPVGARDRVFPGRLFPTHGTFKADLVAAELDGEDDQGRIVDFHSFRVDVHHPALPGRRPPPDGAGAGAALEARADDADVHRRAAAGPASGPGRGGLGPEYAA